MDQAQVHFYDLKSGWGMVPDPLPAGATDDKWPEYGFKLFAQAGVEGGSMINIYAAPESRFLLLLDGINGTVETIVAADLPSMIELVHKLFPLALASQIQLIQDVATDLQELLIREHGPLEDAYHARWNRQRAEVESRRKG